MNVQRDDMRNRWVEGPLYIFTELFTEKILDNEGLKQ